MFVTILLSLLSSCLLSKNLKIKLHKTIFYLLFCMRVKLTLREEHGLTVFENRVLKIIFGPKK